MTSQLDDNSDFGNYDAMEQRVRVQGEIVFPNNIKNLRLKRELTQAQLGRLMEPPLSESTISKMESGERRLTNLQLADLAAILDCRAEDIPVVSGRDAPSGVRRWQQAQQDAVRHSIESGAAATGYVLALLRKRYGKTMQQVADAIGMTLSVYHRVEMASRILQHDEIEAVAKFYDLTAGQLIAMFERRAGENRKELESGTPPERLLPRAPRALLKEDGRWGRFGAIERYALRRSIRYVGGTEAPAALPVHGGLATDANGDRRFTIDRDEVADSISLNELAQPGEGCFFVRNFSQRLGFLLRPGALAYVDPSVPAAMGDIVFLTRKDGTADAAVVIGDGIGPLMLKMYNPEEQVSISDPSIATVLRVGMLILS
jgi:transcriptional regulator with XRE-family HTH domain